METPLQPGPSSPAIPCPPLLGLHVPGRPPVAPAPFPRVDLAGAVPASGALGVGDRAPHAGPTGALGLAPR